MVWMRYIECFDSFFSVFFNGVEAAISSQAVIGNVSTQLLKLKKLQYLDSTLEM